MDLSTEFGKEIPSRNLHEKRSDAASPCDCSDQLQGVPGPPGPKCQKSLKKDVSVLSAWSAKKVLEKSKESRKSAKERLFREGGFQKGF